MSSSYPSPRPLSSAIAAGGLALVSTNSITQGEAVAILWKPLMKMGVHIDFAHRTFRWSNENKKGMAHVYCVIVGFSTADNDRARVLFIHEDDKEEGEMGREVACTNINAYLVDAPNMFVESRVKPLCNVLEMMRGSQPTDGGHYIFTEKEKAQFLKKEPKARKWMRPFVSADDYIRGTVRWCLWLVDCPPNELTSMKQVMHRIEAVKQFRLQSNRYSINVVYNNFPWPVPATAQRNKMAARLMAMYQKMAGE